MDEMEEKLGAILGNPQMMQQIMSMAQSLGGSQEGPPAQEAAPQIQFDPALISRLSSLAGSTSVDPQQHALLQALQPYVSQGRVSRLEKAMHAAKIARVASVFLNQGGLSFLTGR